MDDLPSYPKDAAEREEAVVPEAAAAEFASWGSRVGASLIDGLVLIVPFVVVLVIVLAIGSDEDSGAWAAVGFAYLLIFALPFVYFTVMLGGPRGQTYGKRAIGIRVVGENGDSIGYGRAFGRYAITFVFSIFFLPLVLDYLWPLWDTRNQALHDKVVNSFVVRT